jgi:hypothetical protein
MKNIIINNLDLPNGNIDHTHHYHCDRHYLPSFHTHQTSIHHQLISNSHYTHSVVRSFRLHSRHSSIHQAGVSVDQATSEMAGTTCNHAISALSEEER